MRETEMREALRELCDDLDARARRRGRAAVLGSAIGLAALALSACVEVAPQPAAADAGRSVDVQSAKDGRADVPIAVAVYSAPGCSFVSPRWGR